MWDLKELLFIKHTLLSLPRCPWILHVKMRAALSYIILQCQDPVEGKIRSEPVSESWNLSFFLLLTDSSLKTVHLKTVPYKKRTIILYPAVSKGLNAVISKTFFINKCFRPGVGNLLPVGWIQPVKPGCQQHFGGRRNFGIGHRHGGGEKWWQRGQKQRPA